MTSAALVTWLGWACYAGAAASLGAYLAVVLGRQGWRRPWNAAGLVFTSLALSQTPYLFDEALHGRGVGAALTVTFCLLAAAAAQAYAALRPRRRDGVAAAAGAAKVQGQDA